MGRTAGLGVCTRHTVLKNFVDQRVVNGGADIGDGDGSLRFGRGQGDGDFALSGAVTLGVLQDVGDASSSEYSSVLACTASSPATKRTLWMSIAEALSATCELTALSILSIKMSINMYG